MHSSFSLFGRKHGFILSTICTCILPLIFYLYIVVTAAMLEDWKDNQIQYENDSDQLWLILAL